MSCRAETATQLVTVSPAIPTYCAFLVIVFVLAVLGIVRNQQLLHLHNEGQSYGRAFTDSPCAESIR